MRDSFVPMNRLPKHDDLLSAINDGFSHFKLDAPTVTREMVGPHHLDHYVKGFREDEWCWVSISEWPEDERTPESSKYMGIVSTRGSNLFAAVVAFSLCWRFGESIDDNAGYLSVGREFTLADFEEALRAQLAL